MINVFVTGAGAPGGPGIIKALALEPTYHIITGDTDPLAAGRFLGHPFHRLPKATDEDYIPFMLDLCRREKIRVLFPLVTMELFKYARHLAEFRSAGTEVIVSEQVYLDISNNKRKLLEHLRDHQVPIPEFHVVRHATELTDACRALGYPARNVVMKPSVSNGSRGVRIISESRNDFDLLFNEKPGSLYASLDSLNGMLQGREIPELLITEYLPGEEFTIDTIVSKGEARLIIPRRRTRMIGGISVRGEFVQHQDIIEYSRQVISTMTLDGPIGLQVKADHEGRFRILEINPRIQGTSVAALGTGVNLPVLAVKNALGSFRAEDIRIKWDVGFVRYYTELYYDIDS